MKQSENMDLHQMKSIDSTSKDSSIGGYKCILVEESQPDRVSSAASSKVNFMLYFM